jgi:transcriptional regulator with XRE-family HTH domain
MISRIQEVIKYSGVTDTQFADMIEMNRSNLSHILNGRHQPSLDILLKISNKFPEISFEWLAKGIGNMLISKDIPENASPVREQIPVVPSPPPFPARDQNLFDEPGLTFPVLSHQEQAIHSPASSPDPLLHNDDTGDKSTFYPSRNREEKKHTTSSISNKKEDNKVNISPSELNIAGTGTKTTKINDSQEGIAKKISRVIFIYEDDTFETFLPHQK